MDTASVTKNTASVGLICQGHNDLLYGVPCLYYQLPGIDQSADPIAIYADLYGVTLPKAPVWFRRLLIDGSMRPNVRKTRDGLHVDWVYTGSGGVQQIAGDSVIAMTFDGKVTAMRGDALGQSVLAGQQRIVPIASASEPHVLQSRGNPTGWTLEALCQQLISELADKTDRIVDTEDQIFSTIVTNNVRIISLLKEILLTHCNSMQELETAFGPEKGPANPRV